MKSQPKLRIKTIVGLAAHYHKGISTIRNWLAESGLKKKNGYYSLVDWDAWIKKYKSGETQEATLASIQLELKKAELREKLRLEKAIAGKTVDAEEVRLQCYGAAKQITAVLTRIPPQIGSILGVEAQRRAQAIVEEALNILKENPLGEIRK